MQLQGLWTHTIPPNALTSSEQCNAQHHKRNYHLHDILWPILLPAFGYMKDDFVSQNVKPNTTFEVGVDGEFWLPTSSHPWCSCTQSGNETRTPLMAFPRRCFSHLAQEAHGDRSNRFGKCFEIMGMRMKQRDPKIHWDLEWQLYRNESLGLLSREHSYL